MIIEEKLDYFTDMILHEAEAAKRRAARKETARVEALVSSALEEARVRIGERVRVKVLELKKIRFKQIAAVTSEERKILWERQLKLAEILFKEAEERLALFAVSDAYEEYKKDVVAFAEQAGFDVSTINTDNANGGFVIYNKTRTKQADFTFASRMARKMAMFIPEYDDA